MSALNSVRDDALRAVSSSCRKFSFHVRNVKNRLNGTSRGYVSQITDNSFETTNCIATVQNLTYFVYICINILNEYDPI